MLVLPPPLLAGRRPADGGAQQRLRGAAAGVRIPLLDRRHVRPRGQHVVLDLALVGAAQDAEQAVLAPPRAPRVGRDLRVCDVYESRI